MRNKWERKVGPVGGPSVRVFRQKMLYEISVHDFIPFLENAWFITLVWVQWTNVERKMLRTGQISGLLSFHSDKLMNKPVNIGLLVVMFKTIKSWCCTPETCILSQFYFNNNKKKDRAPHTSPSIPRGYLSLFRLWPVTNLQGT